MITFHSSRDNAINSRSTLWISSLTIRLLLSIQISSPLWTQSPHVVTNQKTKCKDSDVNDSNFTEPYISYLWRMNETEETMVKLLICSRWQMHRLIMVFTLFSLFLFFLIPYFLTHTGIQVSASWAWSFIVTVYLILSVEYCSTMYHLLLRQIRLCPSVSREVCKNDDSYLSPIVAC